MRFELIIFMVFTMTTATVYIKPKVTGYWYKAYTKALNFDGAVKSCRNMGGDLATPSTAEIEQEMISVLGMKEKKLKGKSLWVNLKEDRNNKLTNGQTYTNYYKSNPDNYWGWEDCVGIYYNNKKWYDQKCSRKFPYICKLPKTSNCYTGIGESYNGLLSVTKSKYKCQRWDTTKPVHTPSANARDGSNFPEGSLTGAGNLCRNPDGYSLGPWCYTTDTRKTWELCDVPQCYGEITWQGQRCLNECLLSGGYNFKSGVSYKGNFYTCWSPKGYYDFCYPGGFQSSGGKKFLQAIHNEAKHDFVKNQNELQLGIPGYSGWGTRI